jgi:hypothetical protein
MPDSDRVHLTRVQELGCIVCRMVLNIYSPAEIHHVLDGGRRLGHQSVLPLCPSHHRGGSDGTVDQCVSRHPYKKRFEDKYGTEAELLERVKERLYERFGD